MKKETRLVRSELNGIPYIQYNECEVSTDLKDETKEIVKVTTEGNKIFLYEVREDGNGMKHKIANVMHPDNVQQEGIVEVVSKSKSKRNEPSFTIPKTQDPTTGIIYAEVEGINRVTKEFDYKKVELVEAQFLDMNSIQERRIWMQIQRHHALDTCPYPSNHKSYFKVVDKERDAKLKMIKIKARGRAIDLISDMQHGELVDMATNVGITENHNSEETLKAALMEFVEKDVAGVANATLFCELYDNNNRQMVTILNRCRVCALVTFDPNSGYTWKTGVQMGMTEHAAINYMNANTGLVQTMDFESKEQSGMFKKFATSKEKETLISKSEAPAAKVPSEFLTDADLRDKMRQMNEQANRLDEIEQRLLAKEEALETKLKAEAPAPIVEAPKKTKTAEDFDIGQLQHMAFEYKMDTEKIKTATKQELFYFIKGAKKKEKELAKAEGAK